MGSWTNERNCSTTLSKIGPRLSLKPSGPSRIESRWSQIRSSDQALTSSSASHWKYMRCTVGVRWLIGANPRGEWQ